MFAIKFWIDRDIITSPFRSGPPYNLATARRPSVSLLVQRRILLRHASATMHREVKQRETHDNGGDVEENRSAAPSGNESHLSPRKIHFSADVTAAQYKDSRNLNQT
jgi:hypothetical protein